MHEVVGLRVLVDLAGHRANHGQLIGTLTNVRKHAADRNSTVAMPREFKRTGKDVPVVVEHRSFDLHGHWFSRLAREARLGVEGIDVGDATRHVAEDHILCFGRKMGSGKCPASRRRGGRRLLADQPRQGQHSESGRGLTKHRAARKLILVHGSGIYLR